MMFDTQNYEHHFPVKWWPFFKTKWPLLVVFCSLVTLVNKIQLVKAIQPFKKATISLENDVHSFLHPIIHSFYNKCGKGTFSHPKKNPLILALTVFQRYSLLFPLQYILSRNSHQFPFLIQQHSGYQKVDLISSQLFPLHLLQLHQVP